MKRFILFALIVFISHNLFSQENNQIKNRDSYIYCEILGTQKLLSNKVAVTVDFGQNTRFGEDTRLRDETGKVIIFNSMVDAMNWMGGQGWEFIQAYVVTSQNQNVYHWLLKLDIKYLSPEELSEVKAMFKTKRNIAKDVAE
ncbi:MAG: hypothetical protein PHP30_07500 [Bacteroidales bacterium]|nr:hypothetical protein [Bacteroidales bacterium]MDD3989920.1 hypothetical protein [Bacteroidales bacterium]MDD4639475.1 hypothetical protein [Bacteroidales bacterium]